MSFQFAGNGITSGNERGPVSFFIGSLNRAFAEKHDRLPAIPFFCNPFG